jgi:hypothetical protein
MEHPQDIANTLASTISVNSSNEHFTKNCQKIKTLQEKRPLKFLSDNTEAYNQLFSITELQDALRQTHDTAVGPDEIHYQMLKYLPEISLSSLLEVFNKIGQTGFFPPDWSDAIIISLPKPDSFSCIKALENRKLSNSLILEILELVHKLVTLGYSIHFIWVPSHIGIAGNAAADAAANAALNLQLSMLTVPYSDFKSLINTYIKKRWQECWDVEANNKLQPVTGSVTRHHLPRRDEVIIHRLRVGHTHLTHCYLLRQELLPRCEFCHSPLSVEHALITCSSFSLVRRKFYDGCDSLQELFKRFSPHVIVKFIKEIGFYCKISVCLY